MVQAMSGTVLSTGDPQPGLFVGRMWVWSGKDSPLDPVRSGRRRCGPSFTFRQPCDGYVQSTRDSAPPLPDPQTQALLYGVGAGGAVFHHQG